jgi:hypothetical protein
MDVNEIPSLKQTIRKLKKEKAEILTSSPDKKKVKRIRTKIKLLKRQTRELAREKKKMAATSSAEAMTKTAAESSATSG